MSKKKTKDRDSVAPKRDKDRTKMAAAPTHKASAVRGKDKLKSSHKKDSPLKTKTQDKASDKSKKSSKSDRHENEKVREKSARQPAATPTAAKGNGANVIARKPVSAATRNSAPVKISKEMMELRARLQTMLGEMRRDIDHEVRGASERDLAHINDTSDMASDAAEGDLALRIAESETVEAEEIERSIEKIDNGTYGICEMCNKAISAERLKFLPYVTLCIKCQELAEIRRREDGDELDDLAEGAETDNDA